MWTEHYLQPYRKKLNHSIIIIAHHLYLSSHITKKTSTIDETIINDTVHSPPSSSKTTSNNIYPETVKHVQAASKTLIFCQWGLLVIACASVQNVILQLPLYQYPLAEDEHHSNSDKMRQQQRRSLRALQRHPFFYGTVVMTTIFGSLVWRASRLTTGSTATRSIPFFLPSVAAFSAPPTNRQSTQKHPIEHSDDKNTNQSHIREENDNDDNEENPSSPPWSHPRLSERAKGPKTFRSRQHVNPLASKFQQPTVLSEDWPRDVFSDLTRPLFLDIGCSRGGFLLDIAAKRPDDYNYLGLEIRPMVVHHAQDRLQKRSQQLQGHLDFVGCNANVDLDRLLTLFTEAVETPSSPSSSSSSCNLQMVCVQFPDPHFKVRHAKRRVVTPELVQTLAKFMPPGATVFLQSDVQSVLDDMRLQFREEVDGQGYSYFADSLESVEDYVEDNILGIPTEREVSVLNQNLPVYRSVFTRTEKQVS